MRDGNHGIYRKGWGILEQNKNEKKQKEIRDSLTSFSKALCPCTIKTHGLFLVDCRPSSLLSLHGICLLPIKEDKINIG